MESLRNSSKDILTFLPSLA